MHITCVVFGQITPAACEPATHNINMSLSKLEQVNEMVRHTIDTVVLITTQYYRNEIRKEIYVNYTTIKTSNAYALA